MTTTTLRTTATCDAAARHAPYTYIYASGPWTFVECATVEYARAIRRRLRVAGHKVWNY